MVATYPLPARVDIGADAVGSNVGDIEGLACDPANDRLFVSNGVNSNVLVYGYTLSTNSFELTLQRKIDIRVSSTAARDVEGIAYDATSGNLFVTTTNKEILEYTTDGAYVRTFSLAIPNDENGFGLRAPQNPGGLDIGPSSDGSGQSFYITDARDDESKGAPYEGAIYEAKINRTGDNISSIQALRAFMTGKK